MWCRRRALLRVLTPIGVTQEGRKLLLEYGKKNASGGVDKLGETQMLDIGPKKKWRNLRLPINDLPKDADAVRIYAEDDSLDPEQWLVVTRRGCLSWIR